MPAEHDDGWEPLPFTGPLDFPVLLAYFARRAIGGVEQVDLATGPYRRTVAVDGAAGVIELRHGGPHHLLLRTDLPDGLTDEVVARARRIFALDIDPTEALTHLSSDPALAPSIAARPGLRVPGTWDPFETGVRTIVGQQVSVAGASTVTARLVQRVGNPLETAHGGLTHTFPTPAVLAAADLAGIGMPGARVAAIQGLAAAISEGRLRLDGSVALDELIEAICAIRGLGPWTASYLAMRMGQPDAFPAADLGLRKAVSTDGPLTTKAMTARAEAWRPWRAQAALRLWMAGEL
jgi:3-methyladenine DNA glycosylase/8-oxoguanine DNA glycosylase